MVGRVVSNKGEKTAVVLVERVATHPLYGKRFLRSKRYLVDDAIGVKEGDVVEILPCRPISKNKTWKVVKVVGQNLEAVIGEQLKEEAAEAIAEVMPEEEEEKQEEPVEEKPKTSKKGGKK